MIATDTNILVYAHRTDSEWHEQAWSGMRSLWEGRVTWGLLWPCIHEFIAIVTHPRIYSPPSTTGQAIDQVDAWLESPVVELLAESDTHWTLLKDQLVAGRIRGPLVHDARIAALCIAHGVTEFWSADRDFSRLPMVPIRNPLVGRRYPTSTR